MVAEGHKVIWFAGLSLVAWLALLTARRGFWRAEPVLETENVAEPGTWPDVTAIVPARNEALSVEQALRTILGQPYPGHLRVILVNDHSEDATRSIAEVLAASAGGRLAVIDAPDLPQGWSGKVWAMHTGFASARDDAPFVWFTDADIAHDPRTLERLVAKAISGRFDVVSLMVRLDVDTPIERLLIPPFVFFFQKLYPFATVNDRRSPVAAAAGGCMLVRRAALEAAGGLEAIQGELIDDVALARTIKHRPDGPHRIWLGHGVRERSLRRYTRLREIWDMVARSADEQLRHSLMMLGATVLGMALLYLVPVVGLLGGPSFGQPVPAVLGAAVCGLMTTAFAPTARLYGIGWGWRIALPLAAILYVLMTVSSAWRFRRRRGGQWKGRVHRAVRRKDTVR